MVNRAHEMTTFKNLEGLDVVVTSQHLQCIGACSTKEGLKQATRRRSEFGEEVLGELGECRRCQLIDYFDCSLVKTLPRQDPLTCCDVCVQIHTPELQKLMLDD